MNWLQQLRATASARSAPREAPIPGPKAAPADLIEPTPEEAKNGWTAETLAAYQAELRAEKNAAGITDPVGGFVVTEFTRPRAPIRIERSRPLDWGRKSCGYDPHSLGRRTSGCACC